MNDEHEENQPLSRQAYRQQRRQTPPTSAETPQPDLTAPTPDQGDNQTEPPLSRRAASSTADAKTQRLRHKLNLTIMGLVAAIIVVYLVLFFVG